MEIRKELQEMSLERRLATLNLSHSQVPVPPPRSRKLHKRLNTSPDSMTTSPTKATDLYMVKSHSFHDGNFYRTEDIHQDRNGVYDKLRQKESYHKYEVIRKDDSKETDKHHQKLKQHKEPMCDIVESSQKTSSHSRPLLHMKRPDILRGSFNADLKSKLAESSKSTGKIIDSNHEHQKTGNKTDDNRNLLDNGYRHRYTSDRHPDKSSVRTQDSTSTSLSSKSSRQTKPTTQNTQEKISPTSSSKAGSANKFMFYRPKVDKLHKQHNSAIGLVGMGEVNYTGGKLLPSPEGSFVNPAFDIVDNSEAPKPLKPVVTRSRPVYSTMGSSFSTRPCTPSPPSQKFRNKKPPIPTSPEPPISPPASMKPLGPSPIKPLLSAKQLETSLKQYSSQSSRLDTRDMCSPEALENMMKYYNMDAKDTVDSESPTPPLNKLSSSKKNQSPYSSSGSLNISGDSIDVVLRRKKKVKIRPPSLSSDDESVKRVSLEINLAPSTGQADSNGQPDDGKLSSERKGDPSNYSSQTSLNQTVEKMELDDLTSTEAAKLLKKQFAKLKVKASNLKAKDSELKQRFANLQSQRGRVCGNGGVTKAKARGSQTFL